jgi:glutamate racemase
MKIGVFDSGVGGEAVAAELRRLIPLATVVSVNDHAHVPYGGRPRAEIMKLTRAAVEPLVTMGCDAIVIACNTATTNAIQLLRHDFPQVKFVGLEPMVKPAAALTKTRTIAVLATPATLQSHRYAELKNEFTEGITVLEPDCSDWAGLIEAERSNEISLKDTLAPLLQQNSDVIVLGCTHYHWLKPDIEAIVGPNVTILEPSDAIRSRLESILG